MLLPRNVADEVRLQAAEPYNAGKCATVVYKDKDPTSPWAEFFFTYKSMSISTVMTI